MNCWRLKICFVGLVTLWKLANGINQDFSPQRPDLLTLCVCVCLYVCMCIYMILCVCVCVSSPQNKYSICGWEETTVQGNILDEPDWSIIMVLKKFGLRGPKFLAFLIFGPWTMPRPSPQHSDLSVPMPVRSSCILNSPFCPLGFPSSDYHLAKTHF